MVSWEWRIDNGNFSQRIENGNTTCKCVCYQFDTPKVSDIDSEFEMISKDENRELREKTVSWEQRIENDDFSLSANTLTENLLWKNWVQRRSEN